MADIDDFYPNIGAEDAPGLADHIDDLRAELLTNPAAWGNITLESYLEALSAVFRDHQPHLLKGHERGALPYPLIAQMLQAATIYE
jgi:hypothetical protein